jgi:adenylyl-sulfate kinase
VTEHASRGAIVWFTGLPASGKTTLARQVQAELARAGRAAVLLDSDELREVLEARSYAPGDRARFYRSLAALAVLLARQGAAVLVAATAPHRVDRERARAALAEADAGAFVEVWVKTPLAECEARDPKGLYANARRGGTRELPGVDVVYEEPQAPEVVAKRGEDVAAVGGVVRRLYR